MAVVMMSLAGAPIVAAGYEEGKMFLRFTNPASLYAYPVEREVFERVIAAEKPYQQFLSDVHNKVRGVRVSEATEQS